MPFPHGYTLELDRTRTVPDGDPLTMTRHERSIEITHGGHTIAMDLQQAGFLYRMLDKCLDNFDPRNRP